MKRIILFVFVLSWPPFLLQANEQPLVTFVNQSLYAKDIRPTAEQLEAWRKGDSLEAAQQFYQFNVVAEFIIDKFIDDVAKSRGIVADPQHISAFKQAFVNSGLSADALARLAQKSSLRFAVDRYLYETHGGVVIADPSHPMMPIEAYVKTLLTYQVSGQLVISSKVNAQLFWQSFERPKSLQLTADKVNFQQPWWVGASSE